MCQRYALLSLSLSLSLSPSLPLSLTPNLSLILAMLCSLSLLSLSPSLSHPRGRPGGTLGSGPGRLRVGKDGSCFMVRGLGGGKAARCGEVFLKAGMAKIFCRDPKKDT